MQRVKETGVGDEQQCLAVLHTFLDCAERALEDKEGAARTS